MRTDLGRPQLARSSHSSEGGASRRSALGWYVTPVQG